MQKKSEGTKEKLLRIIDNLMTGPLSQTFQSIGLLLFLITYRDSMTPDLFHFTTCLQEEEAHFLWVMFLWMCHKCFLSLEEAQVTMISSEEKLRNEKLKVIVKGAIELFIAMVVTTPEFESMAPWFYLPVLYAVAALRTLYDGILDLTLIMFILCYQL